MINIRPAGPDDVAAIAGLLEEMDRFYGSPDPLTADERAPDVYTQLFASTTPAATVLVAWSHDEAVGLASYSFLWPAVGETRSLYLKELYVRQDQRGTGAGTALMAALAQVAVKHECSRFEWTTDRSNLSAQRFYSSLGASENPDKAFYRVEGDEIRRLADRPATSR